MNPQANQNFREDEATEDELSLNGSPASLNEATMPQTPAAPEPDAGESAKSRRPRGKIARLRKEDRDRLNCMLRDGVAYADVITKLGDAGKGLIPRNVSSWHTGVGYQRWQMDQEWREDIRADQESGLDLLPDFDAGKFNEAALQVAITQLFRALRHLGSTPMKDKLGGDVHNFARLVHALARASRETLNLQKHREAASNKAAASELKNLNPDRDLTDNEYALLVNKMDQVFKVARPKPQSTSAAERRPDSA